MIHPLSACGTKQQTPISWTKELCLTMLIKKRLEWCFIPKIPRTVQTLWLHEERTPRAFHKDSLEILCMRYNLIWIAVDLMKDDEY